MKRRKIAPALVRFSILIWTVNWFRPVLFLAVAIKPAISRHAGRRVSRP